MKRSIKKAATSLAGLMLLGVAEGGWVGPAAAQGLAAPAPSKAADDDLLPRTYLNKLAIQLPIHIDNRVRPTLQEIRLFVKATPGEAWQLSDKATSTQSAFNFQATRDGDYLFTMQTVDRNGRTNPPDLTKEAAGLAVVVDTQPPTVELTRLGSVAEGLLVQFVGRDEHLDTLKTALFYQTGDRVFRPTNAVPDKANVFAIPHQAVFTGMIRAIATDLAGNATTHEINIAQLPAPGTPAPAKHTVAELPRPLPKRDPLEQPLLPPPPTTEVGLKPLPAELINVAATNPVPTVDAPPTVTPLGGTQQTTANKVAVPPTTSPVRPGPSFVEVQPGVPGVLKTQPTVDAPAPRQETSVARQVLNAAHLSINYGIEKVGPSGVGKVEVWVTRDESKTWTRLCDDPDRKSPVEVELPGEGGYGITLVVGNGRGFGATPPVAGDAPQMLVEVDTTRPTLEIGCTRQIVGGAAIVEVKWTARDRNLAGDGVDLFYATTRQGPWLPLLKGQRGEGLHRWNPSGDVGQQVFLRLTARDEAGNVATSETAEPIVLDDLSRPRGNILGISTTAPQEN